MDTNVFRKGYQIYYYNVLYSLLFPRLNTFYYSKNPTFKVVLNLIEVVRKMDNYIMNGSRFYTKFMTINN